MGQPYRFTRENARDHAIRGNIIRWRKPPSPQTSQSDAPRLPDKSTAKIILQTFEHIQACFKRLTDAPRMPPDELDALTRSLERLWKIHAHAAQIAQPAHVKLERKRRGDMIDLEPAFALLPESQVTPVTPIIEQAPVSSGTSHSPMTASAAAQPSVSATSQGMSVTPPSPVVQPAKEPAQPIIEPSPIIEPEVTRPAATLSAADLAALLSP
jgi:hypothetical protein